MKGIRRSIGLLIAISLGLLLQTISHTAEVTDSEVSASDASTPEVILEANRQGAARVDIEERLEPVEGRINFEQTFSGNADELIVIYTEGKGGLPGYSMGYGGRLFILDPDGEQAFFEFNYPTGIDLTGVGDYLTVRLPKTGEYQVIFEDSPIPFDEEYAASSRMLQIRPSTYYERLLIAAEDLAAEERYEESLALLAVAVEESPNLTAAYLSRVMLYAEKTYNTPAFTEKLDVLDNNETGLDEVGTLELVYETFAAIDSAEQALVVGDLQQMAKLYAEAAEEEGFEMDFFTPELLGEIADFLETGEDPGALRVLLFGVQEAAAEPASEF